MDDASPVIDDALRAEARNAAGILYWSAGRLDRAHQRFSEAITLFRSLKNEESVAKMQSNLGSVAGMQGDLAASEAYLRESLASYRRAGNEAETGSVLNNLGTVAEGRKDYLQAIAYYEESVTIHRRTGNLLSVAQTLLNLSVIFHALKQIDKALEPAYECLMIRQQLEYQDGVTEAIEFWVPLLVDLQRWEDAATLLGVAQAMRTLTESPRSENDQKELSAARQTLCENIGEEAVKRKELPGLLSNFKDIIASVIETNRSSS